MNKIKRTRRHIVTMRESAYQAYNPYNPKRRFRRQIPEHHDELETRTTQMAKTMMPLLNRAGGCNNRGQETGDGDSGRRQSQLSS